MTIPNIWKSKIHVLNSHHQTAIVINQQKNQSQQLLFSIPQEKQRSRLGAVIELFQFPNCHERSFPMHFIFCCYLSIDLDLQNYFDIHIQIYHDLSIHVYVYNHTIIYIHVQKYISYQLIICVKIYIYRERERDRTFKPNHHAHFFQQIKELLFIGSSACSHGSMPNFQTHLEIILLVMYICINKYIHTYLPTYVHTLHYITLH